MNNEDLDTIYALAHPLRFEHGNAFAERFTHSGTVPASIHQKDAKEISAL